MVTSAADLWDLQTKPNQIMHIYPYMIYILVWFGGDKKQLQRSPLNCPWCGIFKKVYHVGVNMHCLVWRSTKLAAKVIIAF